jgi:hypothetical protein
MKLVTGAGMAGSTSSAAWTQAAISENSKQADTMNHSPRRTEDESKVKAETMREKGKERKTGVRPAQA